MPAHAHTVYPIEHKAIDYSKNCNEPHTQVTTPIDTKKLAMLLGGFPQKDYIIDGFTNGFQIHFNGPEVAVQSRNSKSALENPAAVDEKLTEEIKAGRIKGPFSKPPLNNFKSSPLSLREKSTPGTFRLLHNLSAPYDERAVNTNIPGEHTTVKYARLQDAISMIQEVGPGAYLSKADIKSAFRIVPLHRDFHHLMGFCWRGKYYFDTCLAMGLAESCRIFELISDCLVYILKNEFGIERAVKILDDFLFIDPDKALNAFALKAFTTIATECGFPIAWDKTSDEPSQQIVFYGAELNTNSMQVALPMDKLQSYTTLVKGAIEKKSITLRELQYPASTQQTQNLIGMSGLRQTQEKI